MRLFEPGRRAPPAYRPAHAADQPVQQHDDPAYRVRRSGETLASGAVECIAVEVSDRFGDYGLVGAALYETRADALWVETLLMSCRALGRGVEHRVLARLGEIALGSRSRLRQCPFRCDSERTGLSFSSCARSRVIRRTRRADAGRFRARRSHGGAP